MDKAAAWIAAHRKLIVAVVGAAITVSVQVWGTNNPYVSLAILAATSLGIYGAPNDLPVPAKAEQPLPPGTYGGTAGVTGVAVITQAGGAGVTGTAVTG